MIKIIAFGKSTDYDSQIKSYSSRLKQPFVISWTLLSHSGKENEEAIKTESKTILGKISSSDYVIVLDERGKLIDNYELSNKLSVNKNIIIIIGGPYGVSQEIRDRANFVWSLGKLVYPYEIVRLILTEQIYRSQMINLNHPYHHK